MISRKTQEILLLLDDKKEMHYEDLKDKVKTKWFFLLIMNKLINAGLCKKYNKKYSITYDGQAFCRKLKLMNDD